MVSKSGFCRIREQDRRNGYFVKGQVLETAVFLLAVVAALISMQTYFSRAINGRHKQSSDSLGSQFSPRYSSYNLLRETIPFTSESTFSADYGSKEEYKSNIVTRTTDALIVPSTVTAGEFFTEEPAEFAALFGDSVFEVDYSVSNTKSLVDDFSDKKLIDDKLFP
ncbi:MAG: hypothetical protein ABH858_02925 [Candidatus Omnitrophota bacterium]